MNVAPTCAGCGECIKVFQVGDGVCPPTKFCFVRKESCIDLCSPLCQTVLPWGCGKSTKYVFSGVNGRGKVMQGKEVKKEHHENQGRNMKLWWWVYNGVEVIWNVQSSFCRPAVSWGDIAGILGAVTVTMKTWILLVSVVDKCLVP
jgi:hypothetical protein